MIPGIEALKIISRHQGDSVMITTETPFTIWDSISDRQEFHLPLINSMSKASSIGLGVALGRPDLKVQVVDSDGSLLMNLGSLVTIANMAPPNFIHFVYQNNVYGLSGAQPLPGAEKFSFTGLAKAAGYPNVFEFDELEEFSLAMPEILEKSGPTLVCLKVDDEGPKPKLPARMTKHAYPEVRDAIARTSPPA